MYRLKNGDDLRVNKVVKYIYRLRLNVSFTTLINYFLAFLRLSLSLSVNFRD